MRLTNRLLVAAGAVVATVSLTCAPGHALGRTAPGSASGPDFDPVFGPVPGSASRPVSRFGVGSAGIFKVPRATGPFGVGVRSTFLPDPARAEPATGSARTLPV